MEKHLLVAPCSHREVSPRPHTYTNWAKSPSTPLTAPSPQIPVLFDEVFQNIIFSLSACTSKNFPMCSYSRENVKEQRLLFRNASSSQTDQTRSQRKNHKLLFIPIDLLINAQRITTEIRSLPHLKPSWVPSGDAAHSFTPIHHQWSSKHSINDLACETRHLQKYMFKVIRKADEAQQSWRFAFCFSTKTE